MLVRITFLSAIVFAALSATEARAQFVPYYSFGGWGNSSFTLASQAQLENRAQGQQMAQARNARIGSEVRSTLLNEANSRTQAQLSQQQSARDWWFQTQQQQFAQRSAMAAQRPIPMAPIASASEMGAMQPISSAPNAPSLIRWPAALSRPQFAVERDAIEGPFARFAEGGPAVTNAEYEQIIATAGRMKSGLGQTVNDISAADYLGANQFLDQLVAEAHERVAANSAGATK